jgi:hypothetical protein
MAKRQTTQWPKDRQHNGQKTDNTMAKRQTTQWPKDRQHNGQKKKYKRTNNDLQNITQKTTDSATRTQLKTGVNSGAPEGWTGHAPHVTPVVSLLLQTR